MSLLGNYSHANGTTYLYGPISVAVSVLCNIINNPNLSVALYTDLTSLQPFHVKQFCFYHCIPPISIIYNPITEENMTIKQPINISYGCELENCNTFTGLDLFSIPMFPNSACILPFTALNFTATMSSFAAGLLIIFFCLVGILLQIFIIYMSTRVNTIEGDFRYFMVNSSIIEIFCAFVTSFVAIFDIPSITLMQNRFVVIQYLNTIYKFIRAPSSTLPLMISRFLILCHSDYYDKIFESRKKIIHFCLYFNFFVYIVPITSIFCVQRFFGVSDIDIEAVPIAFMTVSFIVYLFCCGMCLWKLRAHLIEIGPYGSHLETRSIVRSMLLQVIVDVLLCLPIVATFSTEKVFLLLLENSEQNSALFSSDGTTNASPSWFHFYSAKLTYSYFREITQLLASFSPCANALVILTFCRPYRNHIVQKIPLTKFHRSGTSTPSTASTVTYRKSPGNSVAPFPNPDPSPETYALPLID
jgi:hypothetical protein